MSGILSAAERLRFEEEIKLFREGARTEEEFRNVRVPMGVYEQRDRGRYMIRFRIPAGRITSRQLMALADAADLYGNRSIHLTTRQDAQLHHLPVDSVIPALRMLLPFGLISKGCGGNTVRNITACPACDLFGDAVFDVAPFVRRLTQKLLADPESYRLPRKLKIAFSACPDDCAETAFADIGFLARRGGNGNGSDIGFQVLAGGGLGAHCAKAAELEPFIPPDEVYLAAAAIRKIWMEKGNYGDKTHARLRHLVRDMGETEFRSRYFAEKEDMREWLTWPIVPLPEPSHPVHDPSPIPPAADRNFVLWKKSFVEDQTLGGYYAVTVPVLLGDMSSGAAGALAEFLYEAGLNELRVTQQQNFIIPGVSGRLVPALYDLLKSLSLARPIPLPLANLAVCAGAGNCQVGVCRSKDVAAELFKMSDRLYWSHPAFRHLSIRLGGCHNNCARPAAAVLGFIGVARSSDGRNYPAYQVLWGGKVCGKGSVLAEAQGVVPARWLAVFVSGFLGRLEAILPRDADADRLIRTGRTILHACLSEFQEAPAHDRDPLFYNDWGSGGAAFTTEGRGKGECAAG